MNNLWEKIQAVLESDDMKSAYKEQFPDEYQGVLREADPVAMLITGVVIIGAIIAKIVEFIKKKQKKDIDELQSNLKIANDKYLKVDYLFNHDSKGKLRLFGKKIDCDIESIVLVEKGNTSKYYQLIYDDLMYDSEYFVKDINNTVAYINTLDKDTRTRNIQSHTDDLIKKIHDGFMSRHGYILQYDPYLKITHYKNQDAKRVLKVYKQWLDYAKKCVDIYNNNLSVQLQFYQLLDQAYNNLINKYGKDKELKGMIDTIFKQLLKNSNDSLDFNSRALTILNEMVKFYIKELDSMYEQFKA